MLDFLKFILCLSIAVYLPFYFRLINDRNRFFITLKMLHPWFAVAAVGSFFWPLLSFVWLFYCVLIGVYGSFRFLGRGGFYIEESLIDFSMMYLPIGGVWFAAYQNGMSLFGFSGMLALLTAIHFHYSSLYGLLFPGLLGRWMKENGPVPRLYRTASLIFIVSPLLVAVGITYSHVVEIAAVLLFLAAFYTYCWFSFKTRNTFLWASSAVIVFTMLLSVLYALRLVDIPFMVFFHGFVNAVLFSGLGLAGFWQLKPESHFPLMAIPFSTIAGQSRIGTNFFSRNGFVAKTDRHPAGMIDSTADFKRETFNPGKINPRIADFYINTVLYDMDVQPRWRWFIYPAALLYKKLSIQMEQMNFPTLKHEAFTEIESGMWKLADEKDSRNNVRAWIRSDRKSGKAIYVAAYSTHKNGVGERFYNVFFPLPFGGMTSILRISHYGKDGVSLTSLSDMRRNDHNGVYLTLFKKSFRIPINETINVWEEEGRIKAYHVSYLFGVRVLELEYAIKGKTENSLISM
ncbi:YndJ family protein [Neobacillus sp. SCS-31]|uniref:YndJ family protein n=1 Tax=Neobacillus oceani TaxID=3115292 RepID=UPI00390677FF